MVKIIIDQEWSAYAYQDVLGFAEDDNYPASPFSMSSYDHIEGKKTITKESELKKSLRSGQRLTKEEKPKWKKMYAGFVRQGMKLEQAKRKASGIIRGITSQEARGHKEELGIVDTDIEIIEPKKYNWQDLFDIHQHMEQQVIFAFPDWLNQNRMARKEDGYVDFQEDNKYKHRQFEWKMFDEDGELRYWLTYEQGEFQKRQMWSMFDFFECKLELKRIGVWG